MTNDNRLNPAFLTAFKQQLPDVSLLTDPADCWAYGYDNSRRHGLPGAVGFPATHQDVVTLMQLCHEHKVPVIGRGRGTGTTGATVPLMPSLVVSFERMNQILSVDPDNRALTVQPGATNQAVQDAAGEFGFFWPPDPTSAAFCTVGGNLAYNSAGPRAVKYGTPRENTLALKAVTGTGQSLEVGAYTSKSVVGYDLTRLLIGSEGTLALITEATLKLTPIADTKHTMRALYRSMQSAASAVSAIMAQPVTPCALEFMDHHALKLVRNHAGLNLAEDARAMLIIEVDGHDDGIEALSQQVAKAANNEGLIDLQHASDPISIQQLWQARKALSPLLRKIAPKKINEDIVVPVSTLPTLIEKLDQLAQLHGIAIVNFGHAGNGNIHVNLLAQEDQVEAAQNCLNEVFELVLSLNGSLSGEHGIGLEKQNYIERELGRVSIELMQQIKRQFDPCNILNPGKMFPNKTA